MVLKNVLHFNRVDILHADDSYILLSVNEIDETLVANSSHITST